MVAKVILIFSIICTTQVFTLKLNVDAGNELGALGLGQKSLSDLDLENNANLGEISEIIKESQGKINKFAQYITLDVLEVPLTKKDNKVSSCFDSEKIAYEEMINNFKTKMSGVTSEIKQELNQKANKSERIQRILEKLTSSVTLIQEKLTDLIQKEKYLKAANQISTQRIQIQEYEIKFFNEIIKLKGNSPKKARKLGKTYLKVRREILQKIKSIYLDLKKCLKS